MKRISRFLLQSWMVCVFALLLPMAVFAEDVEKPTVLENRKSQHHVFEATKDSNGDISYHPEGELIMPGDTFEFKVYEFKNENGKNSYLSLGYWGTASDEHAYTYDFEGSTSNSAGTGFNVTSTKCVSVKGSESITKAGGSQYEVPVQYINNSDYPVLLSLGFSGSMGEQGEWYLTVGLHVSYYKPYYAINYEGSNNDELSSYHWDAGTYSNLNFPRYYWLTDVPYTISIPNPTKTESTFEGWDGTSSGYSSKETNYTNVTVVYDADAEGVCSNQTVNKTGHITMQPIFGNGHTVIFHTNGGSINGRDKWMLEAKNVGTKDDPSYTFDLNSVIPTKKDGDTFLGWCYKKSALYGSFITKENGKDVYDYFFATNSTGMIHNLYAKWASDTKENLEKNEWELTDDGTLWLLNNKGVEKWAKARAEDTSLPGKVKTIKTGYKDENPNYISAEGVFANCTQLEEVTFTGTAVNGYYTFRNCSKLKTINLNTTGSGIHYSHSLAVGGSQFIGCDIDLTINVPEGQLEYYKNYFPDYAYLFNTDPTDHRYPLTVGDQVISDDNLSVQCGEGTATFDPQTNTLTLDHASVSGNTALHSAKIHISEDPDNYEQYKRASIISCLPDLKIVLVGENEIRADGNNYYVEDAIRAYGDLTICGEGSLKRTVLAENYKIEGVPFNDVYSLPITVLGDVAIDGATITKLYADLPETLTIKNAVIDGTSLKAAKGLSIENSLINRDTFWQGPNYPIEQTVIGTDSNLFITQSKIGDDSGQVCIDCGEKDVTIKIKNSKIYPRDMIRAGSGSTMTIENSNLQAWCKEDANLGITGATTIPVSKITLKDCAITKGAWDGESGRELAIGRTGADATGPLFLSYTVSFDTGVGSAVPSQTVNAGEKVQKPEDPTRASFTFDGWYTEKWNQKNAYDFDSKVDSDFTLYAKWTKAGTTPAHTHTADTTKWLSDADGHWHLCTAGDGFVMDKAAHTFDNGKVTKEATQAAEGEMTYTCSVCGYQEKKTIARLESKPATTEPGQQGGQQGGQDQPGTTQTAELPKAGTEVQDQTGATYVVTGTEKDETGKEVATLAYAGDEKASGKVDIPETTKLANGADAKVTEIEDSAFEKNAAVTAVTIPESVKTIGKNAFKDCNNIKTITIKGDEVTAIGDGAFQGCKKLGSFTIGKKVSKVGKNAFSGCSKLKKLYIYSTKLTKKKVGKKAFGNIYKKAVIYYPKNTTTKQLKTLKAAIKKGGAPKGIKYKKLKK